MIFRWWAERMARRVAEADDKNADIDRRLAQEHARLLRLRFLKADLERELALLDRDTRRGHGDFRPAPMEN